MSSPNHCLSLASMTPLSMDTRQDFEADPRPLQRLEIGPAEQSELTELGRMLSLKAIVSDTSSFATFSLEKIGAGSCGTIFAPGGTGLVYKIAKHDTDALTGDLYNDFRMHKAVLRAMRSYSDGSNFARVPGFHAWIPSSYSSWWEQNSAFSTAFAEKGLQVPSNVLCTERIMPLPFPIRSALIENFCPEVAKLRAQQDPSNNDFLVRIYLGAHRVINPRSTFFSLRNYKLHLNQMRQLGMDVKALSRAMAATLACLHWEARVDAKDVEFVLGLSPEKVVGEETHFRGTPSKPETYVGPGDENALKWNRRTIDLWVLDFNLCSRITMDKAGVDMAAKAWQVNDPYYPKPLQKGKKDRELWDAFVSRYIEVSDQILQSEPGLSRLPRDFLSSIIGIQLERDTQKAQVEP